MPILPMYQKPTFLAYDKSVQNMIDNATQLGPTWNAEDWFISEGARSSAQPDGAIEGSGWSHPPRTPIVFGVPFLLAATTGGH